MSQVKANTVQQRKKAFLRAFEECGSVSEASLAVDIDRGCHYSWMKDEKYAADFHVALERAARMLEDEAVKRARTGSDTLLIFLLKCRNRPVFGDRASFEHTGKEGGPIQVQDVSAREQVESRIARAIERARPEGNLGQPDGVSTS